MTGLTFPLCFRRFLSYGENRFFCHARSRSTTGKVDHEVTYFTIVKVY